MKPAPFCYFAPGTLPEALALLKDHGDEAKVLAGGQSLVPAMNMRLVRPQVLVDLNRIPDLAYVERRDGWLHIGAMTRYADIELSPMVQSYCPLLRKAASHIGYPAIRNRGTIGGSVAHNDPAATLPAVLSCLGAVIEVTGPGGVRELRTTEFFLGIYTTALEPHEIVTAVRVPVTARPGAGGAWAELSRRAGDFPLVGVAVQLALAESRIATAAIALTGVGNGPIVVADAAASLVGQAPGAEAFVCAGRLAQAVVDPESDLHASAEYRKAIVKVMVERALAAACQEAIEGGHDADCRAGS